MTHVAGRVSRRIGGAVLAALLVSAASHLPAAAQSGSAPGGGATRSDRRTTCAEATESYLLLCRVYELIGAAFVDPVEVEILAEGAARGADRADPAAGPGGTAPPCPLPLPEFTPVCQKIEAAGGGDAAVWAAAQGMVSYLGDRYSYLMTPDRYRRLLSFIDNESTAGLGFGLALMDGGAPCEEVSPACRPVVFEVYPGSPAARAGLTAGDVLAGLNGPLSSDLACRNLPGLDRFNPGEKVTVEVIREGRRLEIRAEAARLSIPAARGRVVDGSIGYLRLDSFSQDAGAELKELLEQLLEAGVNTLALDLRDNSGGYQQTALNVAALFLEDGTPGGRQLQKNRTGAWSVKGDGIASDSERLPMAVMVDRNSASASEILTAALRDNGRAEVVGERTYGKNSGQRLWEMKDGGGNLVAVLSLTGFRLLGPSGSSFSDGIPPDTPMNLPLCLHPNEVARRAATALAATG